MSFARFESRLKQIQVAISNLNQQSPTGEQVKTIKLFTLLHGQHIYPPQNRMWKILSIALTHSAGVDSVIIVKNKNTNIYHFFKVVKAATATQQDMIDLGSGEIWMDQETYMDFTGNAGAGTLSYVFVSVLELPAAINMVEASAS